MKREKILISLRKIIRAINLESKRIEKEYGISIPQLLCLKFLYEQKNYQSIHSEIGSFLQLSASTTTGIIHRLEKKGYLARAPIKSDRRKTAIILTKKGAELVENTPEPLHRQFSEGLDELDEEKYEELVNAFQLIIDILDIEDIDAAPIMTAQTKIANK